MLDLDDPSTWCRLIEGHLRNCASRLRAVEEKAIEVRVRPRGHGRDRAREAARLHVALLRRAATALLTDVDALEERLPSGE